MSQDGVPATGGLRVRDVQQSAEQWRLGGAPNDTNHTRIIDMAWPQDAAITQAEMLGTYPSSNEAVSNLSEDDFAQMELFLP